MKKKVLSLGIIFILLAMLFILTGCGDSNNNESTINDKNSLASQVKVGDYVSYKAKEGNTYISEQNRNGSKRQEFETTGDEQWRVLSIEDDGTVNLVCDMLPNDSTQVFSVRGVVGYNNLVDELNNIASIWGNGECAVSARSMTSKDVMKAVGLDKFIKVLNIDSSKYNTDDEKLLAIYEEIGNKTEIVDSFNEDIVVEKNEKFDLSVPDKESENGYKATDSITTRNYWIPNFSISSYYEDESLIKLLCTEDEMSYIWYADTGAKVISNSYGEKYIEYWGLRGADGRLYRTKLFISKWEDPKEDLMGKLKVVVTLDKNTKVDGGSGTESDPFLIKK